MTIDNVINWLKKNSQNFKKIFDGRENHYSYKLVEIIEDEGEYTVAIKLANKNVVFDAKPEEILANDSLVDKFSPRDIRTLTYLGYLGVNAPKYKILAKKLSKNEKTIFWIKKKGAKKAILKTADQILNESDIIKNLNSEDSKTVSYVAASESILDEEKQKSELLKELQDKKQLKDREKSEE